MAAALITGPFAAAVRAADEPIRMTGAAGTPATVVAALERFAGEMEQYTRGRAPIRVEANASDHTATMSQLQQGQATMGWVRVADIAEMAPELAMLSVPFLFTDQQKALALLEATWLGPLLENQLRQHNLEPLAFLNAGGLRLAGASAPALGDAAGRQITARPGKLRLAAFQALGLQPAVAAPQPGQLPSTPLFELRSDDLTALPAQSLPAVAETVHANDLVAVVANRQRFGDLPLDIRETSRARLLAAAVAQRGAAVQADQVALANLRQAGAAIAPLPEDQRRQAHDKVKAMFPAALGPNADPSIVATVLAYAG